jgi:hypothetical protein
MLFMSRGRDDLTRYMIGVAPERQKIVMGAGVCNGKEQENGPGRDIAVPSRDQDTGG